VLGEVWQLLGGDAGDLAGVQVDGPSRVLSGPLPSTELATAAVAAGLTAAAELAHARSGHRPHVQLDTRHVADAVRSERFLRIDGAPPGRLFDPLSAFFRTADGWVRLHANYAHHQAALLRVLELPAGQSPDPEQAAARIGRWAGSDLEAALDATGGVGAAVRTRQEWRDHPAGQAAEHQPLVDVSLGSAIPTRGRHRGDRPAESREALPAQGFRVLDLTRVIAGPVATRTLAALGAEVLRIDPPHLPEIPMAQLDTGPGKRTALLDLRTQEGRSALRRLLADADVLVHGYRPGALDALGLGPAEIAAQHPELVTVGLSAWGEPGLWAGRRGFDSIVQAASGLADECGAADAPGVLPAQVLDHATGHLIAAAALRGLTLRATTGRAGHARLSLAATAAYLVSAHRPAELSAEDGDRPGTGSGPAADESAYAVPVHSAYGPATQISPPGTLDGVPLSWPFGAHRWGSDQPRWRDA
jgi:hypothetical protein